jgi:hypothetical protein
LVIDLTHGNGSWPGGQAPARIKIVPENKFTMKRVPEVPDEGKNSKKRRTNNVIWDFESIENAEVVILSANNAKISKSPSYLKQTHLYIYNLIQCVFFFCWQFFRIRSQDNDGKDTSPSSTELIFKCARTGMEIKGNRT